MNVKRLLEELSDQDPEAEVHFAYGYGDHWRTTVAAKVRSVEEGRVVESSYHGMPKVVDEDETGYDEATVVVILS